MAAEEGRLHERRGRGRLRAAGAGPNHHPVFTDRVIATLVVLRFQLPHGALALLYGVDRSTITRAVHEVRPFWPLVLPHLAPSVRYCHSLTGAQRQVLTYQEGHRRH
ncbi:transposase family protein [Streptomyces sp. NPDC001581]|uniref:transposase family protein n=1 Tax=Streptomyces sp. NPDC001581 TaxID=3154386 RepID=UPI003325A570